MKNTIEKAKIKEIFSSIQGEGIVVGTKQLFIRFCNCNLRCDYCDTDFSTENNYKDYTVDELVKEVKKYDLQTIHSISLTGGEPLLWTKFLKQFIPKVKTKIYLETNGTLYNNLEDIINNVDIIAADIKLPSCSGIKNSFEMHEKFFEKIQTLRVQCAIEKAFNCDNNNLFAKVVFDENITDEEIHKVCEIAKKNDITIILQPKMNKNEMTVSSEKMIQIFDKFLKEYKNTRLIPQVHKFINVE